jgi:hypothetical protein
VTSNSDTGCTYVGSYNAEGHKYAYGGKGWTYYKDGEDCGDSVAVECYEEDCGEEFERMPTLF